MFIVNIIAIKYVVLGQDSFLHGALNTCYGSCLALSFGVFTNLLHAIYALLENPYSEQSGRIYRKINFVKIFIKRYVKFSIQKHQFEEK